MDIPDVTVHEFDANHSHKFEGSYSGMVCGAMVIREGYGDACGKSADDPIHKVDK
jgi:hypothetical protein